MPEDGQYVICDKCSIWNHPECKRLEVNQIPKRLQKMLESKTKEEKIKKKIMYVYILYCVSFIRYAHDVMPYIGSCIYHSVRKSRDENVTEILLVTGFRQCANVRPSRVLIRHGF